MTNIIDILEKEQMTKEIPAFSPGDTVIVQSRVIEGKRVRLQAFEGIVIAKRNRGLNSSFTVRQLYNDEGIERVYQTYSKQINDIKIKRRGDVRQSKLYYLRHRIGNAAKVREKI